MHGTEALRRIAGTQPCKQRRFSCPAQRFRPWNLPHDHAMTVPAYSERRAGFTSQFASIWRTDIRCRHAGPGTRCRIEADAEATGTTTNGEMLIGHGGLEPFTMHRGGNE